MAARDVQRYEIIVNYQLWNYLLREKVDCGNRLSNPDFYLTTRKMNHLSKREQKEFIHFAERENGRIKSK